LRFCKSKKTGEIPVVPAQARLLTAPLQFLIVAIEATIPAVSQQKEQHAPTEL